VPRLAGAVGIPLPPVVGNGMVVELEYNKMVKMGGGRESSKFVSDSTAAHLHPCLSQPARHHSAARFRCGRDWSEHERSDVKRKARRRPQGAGPPKKEKIMMKGGRDEKMKG